MNFELPGSLLSVRYLKDYGQSYFPKSRGLDNTDKLFRVSPNKNLSNRFTHTMGNFSPDISSNLKKDKEKAVYFKIRANFQFCNE